MCFHKLLHKKHRNFREKKTEKKKIYGNPDLFVNDSITEKDTYTHLTSAWGAGWKWSRANVRGLNGRWHTGEEEAGGEEGLMKIQKGWKKI